MYTCPVCTMDLNRVVQDILRKTDRSSFECPMCHADLVATAIRTITIVKESVK